MEAQTRKRTVLTDELETELNARSDESWRFEVRETTCMEDDCDCELVGICWWSPLTGEDFLTKIWTAEEVRRRNSMADFAQSIIDKLKEIDGWRPPIYDCDCDFEDGDDSLQS